MWSFKILIYSGGHDEDLGENTIRKMYDITT